MRLNCKVLIGVAIVLTLSACASGQMPNDKTKTASEASQQTSDKDEIKRLSEAARAASITKELTKSAAESAEESSELAQQAKDNPGDEDINAKADAAAEKTDALIDKAGDEAEATVNARQSNAVTTAEASEWQGLGFGVGASLSVDLGGEDRVASASLDEAGIVRIDDEENVIARIILETHYFGNCDIFSFSFLYKPFKQWLDGGNCGIGPFVAIQPGDNDVIDAIGFGLMTGFQLPNQPINDNSSFNIGLGLIVDPNATVLGSGISEDELLPAGETEVRLREEAQFSFLVLTSFAFN